MSIFGAIAAIAGAVPIFAKWLEDFFAWYIAGRIATMREENRLALKKALGEHDQRDLEKVLASPKAGEPSGISGTHIVDSIAGLPKSSD